MKKPFHAFAAAAALALGLALVPATALAQPTETDGIIVTVSQPGAGEVALLSDARAALDEAGIATGDVVSSDDGTLVLEARPAEGQTDEQALATALDLPGVTDAQLNYVYQIIEPVADDPAATGLATTPDAITTQTLRQTILANDPYAQVSSPSAARNQYWLYSANIVDAWELARSQNVVTVAVLDSGITLDHPDLEDNILADLAWDSYYERTLVETGYVSDTTDNGGHGTAVAGVVAGVANNGTGVAGASYNANILPIKVVNDTTAKTNTVALANAFEYLLGLVKSGKAPNVRVINMSLGGYGDAFAEDDLLHSYISDARDDYGIVIVCAGGNGSNGQPQTEPIYPADYEECISVTGHEKDGTNLTYSDYNAYKDISAPGQSILSTSKNGDYASNSGTSLSAPIVSGTVALMLYAEPNATPDEVYEALCQTATPVVDPDHDRTIPDENGVVSGSHGALDAGAATSYLKEHVTRFKDAVQGDWYYNSVMFVGTRGIMNGYNNGQGYFGALDLLARQDAASLIYNLLGHGQDAPDHGFADVVDGSYYQTAVNWCAEQGIFKGYAGTNLFGVNQPISREELMCVIYNIAAEKGAQVDASAFYAMPDHASTNSWAVNAAKWVLSTGVINGSKQPDGSTLLLPWALTTRGEMAAIMMNSIKNGVLPDVA